MKATILPAIVIVVLASSGTIANAATGWNHKAVDDEARASAIVGGFSKSGTRYYHDGLVYIRDTRVRVGSKTISDVVELGKRHVPAPRQALARRVEKPSPSSNMGTGVVALVLLAVLGFLVFIGRRKRGAKDAASAAPAGPSEFDLAKACAIVPIAVADVLPHKGEVFYLRTGGDVESIAEHHHAEYVGGSAGVSVRVMRGVSLRSGAFRGRRVDQSSLDVDDRGTLYLSNQRVLFVGQEKTIDIPFSRLVGVEPYGDGLKINRSNSKPLVLRTGSQREGVILQRIIAKDLQPAPTTLTIVEPQPDL